MSIRPLAVFLIFVSALVSVTCIHEPEDLLPYIQPPPPPPPVVGCDPDTVYFQNEILPLILSSCAKSGCHDQASHQEDVILTNYQNIITTGEIKPGDPGDSKLYEVITESDPDKRMPQPPNNPLTSDQINSIGTWISQGAKNNRCDSTGCDTTDVTYTGTIKSTIDTYCLGCHNSPSPSAGILLASYNDVVSAATSGRLLGAIRWDQGFTPMPYGGTKLPDCKITQMEIWIQNGTPN